EVGQRAYIRPIIDRVRRFWNAVSMAVDEHMLTPRLVGDGPIRRLRRPHLPGGEHIRVHDARATDERDLHGRANNAGCRAETTENKKTKNRLGRLSARVQPRWMRAN